MVPLIRRPIRTTQPTAGAPAQHVPSAVADAVRARPPGSDWLYFTLTLPRARQDELIAGELRRLATALTAEGHADGWFFLRYADPEPHVRLRLRGNPGTLLTEALPRTVAWAASLIADGVLTRTGIETYQREVERYGGPAGIELAEAVFVADSAAITAVLPLVRDPRTATADRVDLAVLGIHDLLGSLGFDRDARIAWYATNAPPPRDSSVAYRQRGARLRDLLSGDTAGLGPYRDSVLDAFARRRLALEPVAASLTQLADTGRLTIPIATLARSVTHLHANRLGIDPATERVVLGLLRRTPPKDNLPVVRGWTCAALPQSYPTRSRSSTTWSTPRWLRPSSSTGPPARRR